MIRNGTLIVVHTFVESSENTGKGRQVVISVSDPDPVPFLTPGSGSQTHIFEILVTIFWVKVL